MHASNTADMYGEHIHVRFCHTEYDIIKKKFSQLNILQYNPVKLDKCCVGCMYVSMYICVARVGTGNHCGFKVFNVIQVIAAPHLTAGVMGTTPCHGH